MATQSSNDLEEKVGGEGFLVPEESLFRDVGY